MGRLRMLGWDELVKITGLSKATIGRMERAGQFPRRRKVGAQAIKWLSSDVESWMRGRPKPSPGRNPATKDGAATTLQAMPTEQPSDDVGSCGDDLNAGHEEGADE